MPSASTTRPISAASMPPPPACRRAPFASRSTAARHEVLRRLAHSEFAGQAPHMALGDVEVPRMVVDTLRRWGMTGDVRLDRRSGAGSHGVSESYRMLERRDLDGGRDRDRTCDPLDVNEVLSR